MDNAIQINNLIKKYSGFELNISCLNVPTGRITGLIGQNGQGKTTTLKCILNLIRYDSGIITVLGRNMKQNEVECKQNLGIVFDDFCFDDELNPLIISKIMSNIYQNWSSEVFNEYLKKFKLTDKKFKTYSKGMKTKLMLATALSHNAKLLIFDEPTSGLDPIFRCEILDELKEYVEKNKSTLLFSTHITSDLERISDNIIMISNGKIVLSIPTNDIVGKYIVADDEKLNDYNAVAVVKSKNGYKYLIPNNARSLYYNAKTATMDDIMYFVNNSDSEVNL